LWNSILYYQLTLMNDQQQDIRNVSRNIYVRNEFCAIFEFDIKRYTRLKNQI